MYLARRGVVCMRSVICRYGRVESNKALTVTVFQIAEHRMQMVAVIITILYGNTFYDFVLTFYV